MSKLYLTVTELDQAHFEFVEAMREHDAQLARESFWLATISGIIALFGLSILALVVFR